MKPGTQLALMTGLTTFIAVLIWQGIGEVFSALATAGWGLLIVTVYHLIPMLSSSIAWRGLLPARHRLSLLHLLKARWIGESVNSMLPVAQIGGELAKARWIMHEGVPGTASGSSVVAEMTITMLTQIIFTMAGLATLILYLDLNSNLIMAILVGMAVMVLLLIAFYAAQHNSLFEKVVQLIEKILGGRDWLMLSGGGMALDQAVVDIYRRRKTVSIASAWRFCSWVVGTGEVWLIMYFLGMPVSLTEAFLLESLGQAIRAAGFIIPASLGIQEGGYLLLGAVLGIPPQTALALSLSKRVRELLLGLPGLLVWQLGTSQRVWKQRQTQKKERTFE